MKKTDVIIFLKYAALAGNFLFILWVSFNAAKSGFEGTIYEKISGAGLIGLLIVNCFLLSNYRPQNQPSNHN